MAWDETFVLAPCPTWYKTRHPRHNFHLDGIYFTTCASHMSYLTNGDCGMPSGTLFHIYRTFYIIGMHYCTLFTLLVHYVCTWTIYRTLLVHYLFTLRFLIPRIVNISCGKIIGRVFQSYFVYYLFSFTYLSVESVLWQRFQHRRHSLLTTGRSFLFPC